MDRQTDRVTGR